jgi:hypothetical protein
MKKSELKEIIKASFLAEAEDSKKGNKEEQERMEGAIRDDRDHIKDLEKDIKDNEEKLAKLKKDFKDDVNEGSKTYEEDDVNEGSKTYEEDDLKEVEDVDVEDDVDVDVKDEEDVDVDVEKDVEVDDEETESDIEVKTSVPGEDIDVEAVQGLLTKAQQEAEKLGDEKLMAQIGNTITYFTRKHVVKVAEDLESGEFGDPNNMSLDVTKGGNDVAGVLGAEAALNLQESVEVTRFKKLAGLIK